LSLRIELGLVIPVGNEQQQTPQVIRLSSCGTKEQLRFGRFARVLVCVIDKIPYLLAPTRDTLLNIAELIEMRVTGQ